jgi:uncharacterized protein involved in exopolysaccharide biosynthesis
MTERRPAAENPNVDAFDVREPLRILRRVVSEHRLIVVLTTIVTVAAVVAYIRIRPPIYQASTTLLSESEDDMGREGFYDRWAIFRKDDMKSEPHLLSGASVLFATMEKLNLGWNDVHHGVGSQFGHWWRHAWLGKRYRELKAHFIPPPESEWDITPERREMILALIDFKGAVSFTGVGESNVGELTVMGPTKQVAEIANTIIETYLEQRVERHRAEAQMALDALSDQVVRAKARMNGLETEVQVFRSEHDIWLDFEEKRSVVTLWAQAEMDMMRDKASLARAHAELEVVDELLLVEPVEHRSTQVTSRNPLEETLLANLSTYELLLVDMLHRFTPESGEVRELQATIEAIKEDLGETDDMILTSEALARNASHESLRDRRSALLGSIASLEAGIGATEKTWRVIEADLETLPEAQIELHRIVREAQLAEAEYRVLVDKQIQARVSVLAAGLTSPSIRVIDPAMPPDRPVWPKTKYALAAALAAGLALGVGAAWLRDVLDNRVRRHHVAGGRRAAPLLGSVRVAGGSEVRARTDEGGEA